MEIRNQLFPACNDSSTHTDSTAADMQHVHNGRTPLSQDEGEFWTRSDSHAKRTTNTLFRSMSFVTSSALGRNHVILCNYSSNESLATKGTVTKTHQTRRAHFIFYLAVNYCNTMLALLVNYKICFLLGFFSRLLTIAECWLQVRQRRMEKNKHCMITCSKRGNN